ncbi:MAG: hypothetical protein QNL88_15655 [Acidobacteriota bacterium]|nr:hypothetical protein [Acidobacteriota bacterium]
MKSLAGAAVLLTLALVAVVALGSISPSAGTAHAAAVTVAGRTLSNTGYAVADVAASPALVAFQVIEAKQFAQSLNGDLDIDDDVIHVLDTATGHVRNLGLAGGRPVVDGALVAFAVPEEDQGRTDLNGDGDKTDTVLHVYNARTGVTSNLGLAVSEWDLRVGDPLVLAIVWEAGQNATDLNADGDATDWVAHAYDAEGRTTNNLALAVEVSAASRFDAEDGIAAFFVDEADQNGTDFNSDSDAFDLVLHVYDVSTAVLTNTQLASNSSTPEVELEDGKAVVRVSEFAQGQTILNGDGDFIDNVLFVHDVVTTAQANVGYECASASFDARLSFAVDAGLVVFRYSEAGQGVSGNGDADMNDAVFAVYDIATATLTNTGFAGPQYSLAVDDGYAAFLVVESHQGNADLNGDGDMDDWVLHLYDHGTQSTSNLTSASSTGSHGVAAGMVAVQVREEEEGIDLNADTDTDDKVLFLHEVTGGAPTNLRLASGGSTWVLSMSDEVLAFRTRESDQDTTDLNGDGDFLDYVGHLHDLSTGLTTNLELATETIAVAEATVAFRVNESQQGMTDLNGDGDASDAVLFVTMLPLFADGFETGNTSKWSSVVP